MTLQLTRIPPDQRFGGLGKHGGGSRAPLRNGRGRVSLTGFWFILLAAGLTAASNLMMRHGVIAGGGFGVSSAGLTSDILNLARQPTFALGVLLYGLAALVWFRVMSSEDLSTGYVLLVSVTFLMVLAGAVLAFDEPVGMRKLLGVTAILFGILLVAGS
jgi:multidrug transporter EmrE-like cation transporter